MSESEPESDGDSAAIGVVRTVTPNFIRKRFALKFALVLLVMGVAIGAIGVVATATVTDQTQERIENEYSSLAVQEKNLVDQWIERHRLTARQTSGNDVYAGNNSTAIRTTLQNQIDNDMADAVNRIYIFTEGDGGHEIVAESESGSAATMEQEGRGYVSDLSLSDADDDDIRVSNARSPPGSSIVVVGFATPVDDSEDRYLLMEVSVEALARQFQGEDRAAGGFTQVVNMTGKTILIDERLPTQPTMDGEDTRLTEYGDGQAQGPIDAASELSEEPSGVTTMSGNANVIDEEYAVGYAPIAVPGSGENWAVLVHGPSSEVFGFVQTIEDWGYIATAGAVLLIGLIGAALGFNTATAIDRLTTKAEAMEEGDLDVEIHSSRIDSIGLLYDAFAEMRDALKQQIQEAEQARKEAEVSRAEAMEMNNYLQDTAEEYSEIMQACARGDLTQRMEAEGENEAMDQIATEFNEMIQELEMTTGQLKTFAVEVEEGGRGVQESAETVRDASEQVADSIQKISDDAYDQKERLQRISEEMDGIADQLETLSEAHPDLDFGDSLDTIQEIASMIDEAAQLGEQAMDESESVAGAAEEQAAELNEVSSRAEELVRYAQYLGDGLNNFETEEEHEFVFQTGAGTPGPEASGDESGDGDGSTE